MIYDSIIDLFKLLFGTIEFLKPYATTVGVLFLILRQNNIRKMINGQLPRRFRDTHESDMQEMRQDIKEVKYDVKLLKQHGGVMGEWTSNLQLNGSKITQTPISIIFYTFLQGLNIRRRLTKMNLSGKKKILAIAAAILINGCNDVFGLHLTPDTIKIISGLGGGYVLIEAILDVVRAWAIKPKTTTMTTGSSTVYMGSVPDAQPTIDTSSNK